MALFFDNDEDPIFADYNMLTQKYDPPKIIARDPQIQEIVDCLRPGYLYGHPSNALIYGKPGTGKSVVLRHVIKDFLESVREKGKYTFKAVTLDPGLKVKGTWSTLMILQSILQEIAPGLDIPEFGVSAEYYYKALCKLMNEDKFSLIVTFEEAEKMETPDILYNFTRANENGDLDPDNHITVFLISNDPTYKDALPDRIKSSLRGATYVFPVYNGIHLRAILEDRKGAFKEGVLDEAVIPKCAALASKDYGDARTAIELLRWAGLAALKEGVHVVEERHVDFAFNVVEVDGTVTMMDRQTPSVKKVLEAIVVTVRNKSSRDTSVAEIITTYNHLCKMDTEVPVTGPRVSQIITELKEMGLISTNSRKLGRASGRTVTLLGDPEVMIARMSGKDMTVWTPGSSTLL